MRVGLDRFHVLEAESLGVEEVGAEPIQADLRVRDGRRQVREQRHEARHARVFFRWLVRESPTANSMRA